MIVVTFTARIPNRPGASDPRAVLERYLYGPWAALPLADTSEPGVTTFVVAGAFTNLADAERAAQAQRDRLASGLYATTAYKTQEV